MKIKNKRLEDIEINVKKVRNLREFRKLRRGNIVILNEELAVLRSRSGRYSEFIFPEPQYVKDKIFRKVINENYLNFSNGKISYGSFKLYFDKFKNHKDYQECKELLLKLRLNK